MAKSPTNNNIMFITLQKNKKNLNKELLVYASNIPCGGVGA